jgi:hypothetical protein
MAEDTGCSERRLIGQFTVGISCERSAPLAEKNAAARHHVLRSLINLHNEHPIYSHGDYSDEVFLFIIYRQSLGARGSVVVKALSYKSEGRGIASR